MKIRVEDKRKKNATTHHTTDTFFISPAPQDVGNIPTETYHLHN